MSQQYFAAQPAGPENARDLEVILGGYPFRIRTAAGVFSADGLDKGTEVLLRKVAPPTAFGDRGEDGGVLVDVGCGWGPLALVLAQACQRAQVFAVDVNERALELCRLNAQVNNLENIEVLDAGAAANRIPAASVDVIWSNPPVRIGKTALHQMWDFWRSRLKPSGTAYLVVGKNLGADPLTRWLNENGWRAEKIASSKGFRILELHPRP